MCVTDQSQMHMADFGGGNIPNAEVSELRDFMLNFYGMENEKFITKATRSGKAYDWFLDFGDKISYHKMSRPSVSYVAMFLNYAQSELSKTAHPC